MITGIETRGITRAASGRGRSVAGQGRFEVADTPGEPAVARAAGTTAVSLDGILSLQEEPDDDGRNQRAHAGGKAVLEEMAAMQLASLGQGDLQAVVQRLGDLLASLPEAADPRLSGILRQIALRARIEMSRASRS